MDVFQERSQHTTGTMVGEKSPLHSKPVNECNCPFVSCDCLPGRNGRMKLSDRVSMDSHPCAKNAQEWGTRQRTRKDGAPGHETPRNGVDIPVNRFALRRTSWADYFHFRS